MELLKEIQLSVMLYLSGACGVLMIFTANTKTMTATRRKALLYMQAVSMLLLMFDRYAYIFRGQTSTLGYWMVRISNFGVFLFSIAATHAFNLYLIDLYRKEDKLNRVPIQLRINEMLFTIGVILLVISQFNGFYYRFDEMNRYTRGKGFYFCYIIPLVMLTIQLVSVLMYRKVLSRIEFIPVFLFAMVPYIATLIQIHAYGLSLTNISLVGMVVLLYFFEIKNLNDLEEAKNKAQAANTAKSRFLTNISHEIRTPINTIMGMNEMILREDASEVPRKYYDSITGYSKDIQSAADSLLSLVNDILDISQIESGNMHLDEHAYNLKDLLKNIVNAIRVKSDAKDLKFIVNVDKNLPEKVYGDTNKIKQILNNILNNAIKNTEEGEITFNVEMLERKQEDCKIRFTVVDTGIGMKPEEIEKLFSAFELLDVVKSSNIQGSGLGIDISRHFAKMLGGTLKCSSEYGKGSTFTLELNQKVVENTLMGEFEELENIPSKGAYVARFVAPDASVLVVDDNPMNLSVIRGLLSATKMYIVTAVSGEECLQKLAESNYDIILLDHMMPGMDGIETVTKIRESGKDLPVIALTANYISNGEEFYTSRGFDGYLPKPVDGETLEKTIRKYLPNNAVMDVDEADLPVQDMVLPDEYRWLEDVEGISSEDGIVYSGGADGFINSLKMFLETLDANVSIIDKAFKDKDIKFYTVKVHALKSSARIIGAMELSELARQLEEAGKGYDFDFIVENNDKLISEYKAFKDKLAELIIVEDDSDKPLIPEDELEGALEALKELAPQMDYDSIEMVLEQIHEYQLPKDVSDLIVEIEKALKTFDWDKMEELLNDK